MRHNPLLLSERAKRVLNRDSVFLIHGVIALALVVDSFIYRELYGLSVVIGINIASVLFASLGALRFFNVKNINNYPNVYLIFYHIIFGLGFGFIAPDYSPYLAIWIILLYVSHFFYGSLGFYLSLSLLAVVLIGQAFRILTPNDGVIEHLEFVITQLSIIGLSGKFFAVSEAVGDKDRKLLVTSIDKAQLERQRLVSLINSMADGVIATDDKGIIKLYNAAALNILDTNENLQDKDVRGYMAVIDKSAKKLDLVSESAASNKVVTSTDVLLVYPDGEKINLFINISPIKLGFRKDAERGFIISFRDITREKSLEEERNEFISVVSHELRTPIAITEANISNAQFIVEKGKSVTEIKSALDAAHKQALFLANMINDLSTLSRAERGKLDMVVEKIDPREIAKSLIDDYKKSAEVKGLTFKVHIDEDTPDHIMSNRLYVREILQNFVTNSIKYTREGSVSVSLKPKDDGIEFSVKDTGIGISKSDQNRVFDKFFRSEDFRTRESSGTGLGLYVTKKLMKLIDADISLKSKLNEGSTFSVYIPSLKQK